jgi:hypothetical protein
VGCDRRSFSHYAVCVTHVAQCQRHLIISVPLASREDSAE